MSDDKKWTAEQVEHVVKDIRRDGAFNRPELLRLLFQIADAHASILREREQAEPVAHVPLHPKTGPLWADTYAHGTSPDRASYPVADLYTHPAQAVSVPDGWKLVPTEATMEMVRAVFPWHHKQSLGIRFARQYKKAVENAPTAPAGDGGSHE